jgi:hypothetical protein
VYGGAHQQDDRLVGEVRFLNAGSVGLPDEGDGAARWLWVADGRAELQRTPDDAAGARRRMLGEPLADLEIDRATASDYLMIGPGMPRAPVELSA